MNTSHPKKVPGAYGAIDNVDYTCKKQIVPVI